MARRDKAVTAEAAVNKGGRPSKVQNKQVVELVRAELNKHIKESERVVVVGRGASKRMVVAKHLEKSRHRLWREAPNLHQQMGYNTLKQILKLHFPHVRNARRSTDICKHCKNFEKYLVPAAKRQCVQSRKDLQTILPTYFHAFDAAPQVQALKQQNDDTALVDRMWRYIEQLSSQPPAGDRLSLSLTDRISLHSSEAQAAHSLKGHVELLDAYSWHQTSARRQSQFAHKLREELPKGFALLQMDFKENVKYPLSPSETSEEWHAQNKLSLTVFGANALVPKVGGGQLEFFVLLVSDILDHDAQAANMSTNTVLAELRKHKQVDWKAVTHLVIVTDCGPHFRSKENAAHFCVTLPKVLNISVEVCWLGEQHGKSGVDRCFGWCNSWISNYILRNPIHSLEHLLQCFRMGAGKMMKDDQQGAQFLVVKWSPGSTRPSKRLVLHFPSFKISRTYSLVANLSKYAAAGAQIKNKVFSDLSRGQDFSWEVREVISDEPQMWRVGYYDQPRSWEDTGPDPGDQNSITRRFADQKQFPAARMPKPKPSFLEACSAKALSLQKAAAKKRRQLRQMRTAADTSPTESSSSSSSSSDDDSAASDSE